MKKIKLSYLMLLLVIIAFTACEKTKELTVYNIPAYDQLYLIGSATPAVWVIENATPMVKDPDNPFLFTWTGPLVPGEFKIPTAKNWSCDFFMPIIDGETDLSKTTVDLVIGGSPDKKWVVTEAGTYTITINIKESDPEPYINIVKQALVYESLYLIGSATPAGNDINNPTPMIVDANNPFLFKWTGNLIPGLFKIPTAIGNIGCDYFMPVLDGETDLSKTTVELVLGGNPDKNWEITDAGTYSITINIKEADPEPYINIVKHSTYAELYLLGSASPAGWDINNPTPMTVDPGDPYTFTWTGILMPGELKIPTETGNWNCDFFMPLIAGETDLTKTTAELVIGGSPDKKWNVREIDAGNYTITININGAPTINFVKNSSIDVIYPHLYLVGDATPAGWNIDIPTPMTVDPGDPYIHTWTGTLIAGQFKIPTATGSWGCNYFMPIVDGETDFSKTTVELVLAGTPDKKWVVTDPGTYTITVNTLLATRSINIVKQ